ncbi:hypothetical protein MNEG_10748, partial [Monoraphidium neglectum]
AAAAGGAASGPGSAANSDDDEADRVLDALIEGDGAPPPETRALITPVDPERLLADPLLARLTADFNAFTYDFFGEPGAGGGGGGELLGGALEDGGGGGLEEGEDGGGAGPAAGAVADLSAIGDFEPLDPSLLLEAQDVGGGEGGGGGGAGLSTWGSMDPEAAAAAAQGGGEGGEALAGKLQGLALGSPWA